MTGVTMDKILITGATGFIGSHLVDQLLASNVANSIRVLAEYNSFGNLGWLESPRIIKDIEIFPGNVIDPHRVMDSVKGCDTVIHLSSLIGIPYSYLAPSSYLQTNIIGTLNLLEASRFFGVKKFIHTSTSEVYGNAQFVPIDETHPINPQSPYAASKSASDHFVNSYFKSFGLGTVIIRPFNTFGPRQSSRAVIPAIVNKLLKSPKFLNIGNLKSSRDFTYVSDTVKGIILSISNDNIIGETIQLGTGFEFTIEEVAKMVQEIMGLDIPIKSSIELLRPPQSEVNRLICNPKKARELLNWVPEFSSGDKFKEALTKTVDYYSHTSDKQMIGQFEI
jgi:NAD dependent epimerase/dehydratase